MFPADRTSVGIIPAQDHGVGVPLVTKQGLAYARVKDVDSQGVVYAKEDGKPVLGDGVCRRFWGASARATGAWAAIFPAIGTEAGGGSGSDASVGALGAGGASGGAGVKGGGAGGGGGKAAAGGAVQPGIRFPQGTGIKQSDAPNSAFIGQGGQTLGGSGRADSPWSIFGVGSSAQGGGFARFTGTTNVYAGPRAGFSTFSNGGAAATSRGRNRRRGGAGNAAGQVGAWFGRADAQGARNARPAGDITGGTTFPNTIAVHPIGDDLYRPDLSFRQVVHALPEVWPALPLGTVFLATAATHHGRQDNLLHPTDPRMYAVNEAGDPAMGSWVCDLKPDDTADCTGPDPTSDGRAAPLQSLTRVVRMPEEAGGNGLAWQLAVAGQDGRHGGGLCYGLTVEPVVRAANITGGGRASPTSGVRSGEMRPAKPAVGLFAHEMGGPLSLGSADDKHKHGTTKDGEPVHGGHLSCDVPFFFDAQRDAPLAFNLGPWERPSSFARRSECFLVYDPGSEHTWVGKKKPGLWRWFTSVPFASEGGGSKPRPTTPDPGLPPTGKKPPGDTTSPPGNPSNPRRPGDITAPTGPSMGDTSLDSDGDVTGEPWDDSLPDPIGGAALQVKANDHSRGYGADDFVVMTTLRSGFTSLAYKPQHTNPGLTDYRGSPNFKNQAADRARPLVLRADVYGKQAGSEWAYTHRPDGVRTGTSAGGIFYSSPEVDILDAASSFAPAGVSKSKAYAAVYGPGVRTAYGLPDTSTGGVKTAVEEYGDAGDLVWAAVDSSGTSAEKLRLTDAGLLTFAGESANEPALRKGGTAILEVRTGNNGAQASLEALTFRVAGAQVVGAMKNGWTAPTGTSTRSGFDTATVTTEVLAQHVKALLADLFVSTGHGLIGP